MREFFEDDCAIDPKWIKEESDPEIIKSAFHKMKEKAKIFAKSKTEKVLFFVYYSGHGGEMDSMSIGYTLSGGIFEIEGYVRELAQYPNAFVIALFDSCREIESAQVLQSRGAREGIGKVGGQLYIIHAVAPTKKAISVKDHNAVSQVCVVWKIT